MILTLMFVAFLILGIALASIYGGVPDGDSAIVKDVSMLLLILGFVGTLACVVVIICSHTRVDYQIERNKLEYESLLAQYKAIEDDSATFALTEMSSIYDKVYKWNEITLKIRCASHSLWSNWFYDKRVVEDLKFIGREE